MVYCQECGTKNEEKAIYCQECGSNINLKAVNILSKPKGNKICPTCETINESENNFCEECGSNLSSIHDEKNYKPNIGFKNCPLCNTKSESKFNFCTECGTSLNLPKEKVLAIKNANNKREINIRDCCKTGWDTIDNKVAIQKVTKTKNSFYTEIFKVIEEVPETKTVVNSHSGSRAASTLAGGLLLGPVGALAGYAAAKSPEVKTIRKDPIKKTLELRIYFSVSIHEKGIKLIKEEVKDNWDCRIYSGFEDPYKIGIIKIPWNKMVGVNHRSNSISIKLTDQKDINLKGELTALKGLYLIIKNSITEEEGWN